MFSYGIVQKQRKYMYVCVKNIIDLGVSNQDSR